MSEQEAAQEESVTPMETVTADEESKKREREETAPEKQAETANDATDATPVIAASEAENDDKKTPDAEKDGNKTHDDENYNMEKGDGLNPAAKPEGGQGETEEQAQTRNSQEEEEDAGGEDAEEDTDKKPEAKKSDNDEAGKENDEPKLTLPLRPIKRARTAYFIFADDKREEIKAKHPGEGVGILARATGQLWATLSEEDRASYQERSAQERERVQKELAKYKLEGIDVSSDQAFDPNALIFPVARIRKIAKLDSDVNGISKEAAVLITKCAELATTLLGQEAVKVAQMQNRRKLLPEDVAQVCATRESFLFLREDVKDLVKDQKSHKTAGEKQKPAAAATAAANSKPLTSYFGAKNR